MQLPVAKGRLASRVGISPEALSRCLQQLSDKGLVVRGRQVIVQDRARVERFCGHDPAVDGAELAVGVRAL